MLNKYVLDSNVFIEPSNRFYGFDIAPGFWQFLKQSHSDQNKICSIDRVRTELLAQKDQLSDWVSDLKLPEFFKQTADIAVVHEFEKMMKWVQSSTKFSPAAKAKFARSADGWLVAFAKVNHRTVVTLETYSEHIIRDVPIPNLGKQFNVRCVDLFEMLRDLGMELRIPRR